jgi:hypothetical protein
MPAVRTDLLVEAGSYETWYWTISDPLTGALLDLTQAGYAVTGAVFARPEGTGTALLALPDSTVWRRTTSGRIYFQPSSATSSTWPTLNGYYQAELTHPSGQTVRFTEGRFTVSPEFVHP